MATSKITCGLEIHQQVDTKKLFCECPSLVQENRPEYTVTRNLRAVVGETGEIDIAAAQQAMKGKHYLYECNDENACLIDLDEEPPRNMREEALTVAIQVGKLFNAQFVDEVQVMRKTVVDGSNTTGFQRTALVAMNGHIETSLGKVTIPTINIEEESARIISKDEKKVYFNEINTLPGSLAFYLWKKKGIGFDRLVTKLVNLALEKRQEKDNLTTTFKSNILEGFSSGKAGKLKI